MLIPGIEIEICGRTWTVPPLTLGQIRRMWPELSTLKTDRLMADPGVITSVVKFVTAALQRNYPDLTEEQVEEMLDIANAPAVFMAVMTGSGLKRSVGLGEAMAAMGNGIGSMGSSPPPSDIASETSTS